MSELLGESFGDFKISAGLAMPWFATPTDLGEAFGFLISEIFGLSARWGDFEPWSWHKVREFHTIEGVIGRL
jgi:hypothetical protein